ncbi:uncharacterized protein [Setaria viridis]|uniref:uncharacterized protein n=1 Tax=Setaria viridis TaxID=4556 RepID=UPI003B3A83ED
MAFESYMSQTINALGPLQGAYRNRISGKRVFIPRIPMSPSKDLSLPFKFKRKQFPIRLSFAMTINKAQGPHGQLYVALSRGVSRETMWVLARKNKDMDPSVKGTKNIVHRDVLEL